MARQDALEHYVGRKIWLPDVSAFLPGDILLTRNVKGIERKALKQSSVIQLASLGRFSHALICSTPPAVVEAIGPGVSTLSLARCFTHDISHVRVLRFPQAAVARQAATLAQQEVGRSYSFKRAVRSIFSPKILSEIDDPGIFCSALVAQAFASAGATPFARTPANHMTPVGISRLPGLLDVTANLFRQTLAPNNINMLSALDGDRVPTLSAEQTQLSAQCAHIIHPLAADLVETYPEAELDMVPSIFGLIEFVVRAVEAIDGISKNRRRDYAKRINDIDHKLSNFLDSGAYENLVRRIAVVDDHMLETALHQSFSVQPNIDRVAMHNLLTASTGGVIERRDAIIFWQRRGGHLAAVRAYLRIETQVMQMLAARNDVLNDILRRIRS